ncbi:MAG: hypothetical protein A3I05_01905 [Deltaproteobacteria bacterium RIFCSPLOWO2_02_FULL_44_10]|nr:MAG: hypothetical protein A3C46_08075 [Deltaproteobacteria bacterium RIFCSPHIGHO2_02_FULL_44_16]OGQ47538.1 MAG: hypothetical protein A3I05_01905 [Deltaproteobacteria bacterium RIFCSPLOWO2_02_FULL_44_10]
MPAKPNIIFEDASLMVIEKPAGVPCLPEKDGVSPTLVDLLKLTNSPLPDFGLVHRLDNDTSGLLIIAKTKDAYENLREQFSKGKIHKEYLALVVGNPPKQGEIERPIVHHPRKKKKMILSHKGRPAHTEYRTLKRYGDHTLLEINISTGVRHQIRVHLASDGYPLAGDRLYQNPKRRAEETLKLDHHLLHASRLVFKHPESGETCEFTSALPLSFEKILKTL